MSATSFRRVAFGAVLLVSAATARAQEFPLTDSKGLIGKDATIQAADVLGRKAIRMTTSGDAEECFAFVPGVELQDGTIDVDLALKVTTPPGVRMPGFIGVAFRAQSDGSTYDMFYVRPGNSRADDQAMRNHAVQYVAAPGFGWADLRRGWPSVYESNAEIDPDAWTHVRIEIAGRTAKLFLNRSPQPSLIVDGLKGHALKGAVALWGYASEEAYFSNLQISSAAAQPVTNGSDASGTWQTTLATDMGRFEGTLQLHRDGTALTGTWSGALGKELPVSGTWRDGYIELSFTGEWPARPGAPQPAPARPDPAKTTLAGWIDGTAGKGRAKIEAHADGRWTATRTQGP